MKKPFFISVILCCLAVTGCIKRDISKYPFEMEGVWYGNLDASKCAHILVITKEGYGQIFPTKQDCDDWVNPDIYKGEVKFKGRNLFIGEKKFRILEKPTHYEKEDSSNFPSDSLFILGIKDFHNSPHKNYKILAKMELTGAPAFVRGKKFVFHKFIDY